jgi:hypothetical protein
MNASAAIEGGWTKGLGPAARGDLHGWKHRFDHVRLMGYERTGGRGRLDNEEGKAAVAKIANHLASLDFNR